MAWWRLVNPSRTRKGWLMPDCFEDMMPVGPCCVCGGEVDLNDSGICEWCGGTFHWSVCGCWDDGEHRCHSCQQDEKGREE